MFMPHVQVEADQSSGISPEGDTPCERHVLWRSLVFAGFVMLMGISALAIPSLASPASSPCRSRKPSGHMSTAFGPILPALRPARLRPAKTPVRGRSPAEVGVADEKKSFSTLRVPDLKAMLKERGLPVSGKKAELVTRLEKGHFRDAQEEAYLEVMELLEFAQVGMPHAENSISRLAPR